MYDIIVGLRTDLPCPHCGIGKWKSYYWHLLSGALGDYLLSTAVSGIEPAQSKVMCGMMRICGMIRTKIVDPTKQAVKQSFVVETIILCEARLPLYSCRIVRHVLLHFYEVGGWADDMAVAPPVAK